MTTTTDLSSRTAPTRFATAKGVQFAYRDLGGGDGPPLLFLHHFTATIDDWDPRVIDGIAAHRRVIIFDNRGVGGSTGKVPTTVSAMARDALMFMDALNLQVVDLLGFSLGGFVAQSVAVMAPARVRRIVLAGTGGAGVPGVGRASRRMLSDGAHGLATLKDPKPLLFFTRTANGKREATAYMSRLRERSTDRVPSTSLRAAARQMRAISRWGSQLPMDLAGLEHPVLVANGEDDRMVPTRASFDLANRLPNARLWIYPDAGHGGVFQHHHHFVPLVLDFLAA